MKVQVISAAVARCLTLGFAIACATPAAQAAFIVEADNVAPAGKAFDHFSSDPPGTGFSLSTVPSTALGLTGNQSAFGNPANTTGPDRYTFRYTPGVDVDNTAFVPLLVLGNSVVVGDGDGIGPIAPTYATVPQFATGLLADPAEPGFYNVYFTTPTSTNVSSTGSIFTIDHDLADIVLNPVNLNDGGTGPDEIAGAPFTGGANGRWLKLATVQLTPGTTYTVTLEANSPTFVSQRAHGVMWEYVAPIPEPAMFGAAAIALSVLATRRRRN